MKQDVTIPLKNTVMASHFVCLIYLRIFVILIFSAV